MEKRKIGNKRWELLRVALPDTPTMQKLIAYVEFVDREKLSEEVRNLQQVRDGTSIPEPFVCFGEIDPFDCGYPKYRSLTLHAMSKSDDAERLQKEMDDEQNQLGKCRVCKKQQEAAAKAYQKKAEHCDIICEKLAEALRLQREGQADAEHYGRVYIHLRTHLIDVIQDPQRFDPAGIDFIWETGNWCF